MIKVSMPNRKPPAAPTARYQFPELQQEQTSESQDSVQVNFPGSATSIQYVVHTTYCIVPLHQFPGQTPGPTNCYILARYTTCGAKLSIYVQVPRIYRSEWLQYTILPNKAAIACRYCSMSQIRGRKTTKTQRRFLIFVSLWSLYVNRRTINTNTIRRLSASIRPEGMNFRFPANRLPNSTVSTIATNRAR